MKYLLKNMITWAAFAKILLERIKSKGVTGEGAKRVVVSMFQLISILFTPQKNSLLSMFRTLLIIFRLSRNIIHMVYFRDKYICSLAKHTATSYNFDFHVVECC